MRSTNFEKKLATNSKPEKLYAQKNPSLLMELMKHNNYRNMPTSLFHGVIFLEITMVHKFIKWFINS